MFFDHHKGVSQVIIRIQGLEACCSQARIPSDLRRSLQPKSAAHQRGFERCRYIAVSFGAISVAREGDIAPF
jgi:hypothetical protein